MAYNDKEGLIDPFNGLEDIKYGKINCVGFSKDRFEEDALRILRAIRFAAQLDFAIMPGTDWEIHKQYKSLKNISVERINSEFCKIVSSNSFCVELLLYKDVFSLFIPELNDIVDFPQNNPYHTYNVFEHTVHAIEHCESEDLVVKLAVFFHDFGKPHSYQDGEGGIRHFKGHGKVSAEITDAIMKRLKFDNETRNNVVELVHYHDATFEVGKKYVKRWLNKLGEKQFRRLLHIRMADISAQSDLNKTEKINKVKSVLECLDEVLASEQCFQLKDLNVNGNDLINIGIKQGKQIGSILNQLLDMVINEEVENDKYKLLNCAKELKEK
jgi:tRNA nucleotidyltransferase (CCA-adding enzyme)